MIDSVVSIKPDTLRCILLVCDTSTIAKEPNEVKTLQKRYFNTAVYWQFGYKVITNWRNVTYLDDKKRPLLKSIIVWNVLKPEAKEASTK